jgi:hypothetical protein
MTKLIANPDIGLILRYVDKIDGKAVVANIFEIKTKKSFEYVIGDHVDGLLVKQIFDDRVIILDEITKYQYVLIVNTTDYEEPEEVGVTRYKKKRKSFENMDITAEFNREISKAAGTYNKYGTSSKKNELEAEGKLMGEMNPLGGKLNKNMGSSPLVDSRSNPNGNIMSPFGNDDSNKNNKNRPPKKGGKPYGNDSSNPFGSSPPPGK